MNAPAYFEIQADDPSRAVAFYREIFGWTFTKAEGLPVEYWRIETEGPRGGLLKRPAKTPPSEHGTNAFVCSMEVENFDAIAARIVSLVCAGTDISSTLRAIRLAFSRQIRRRSSIICSSVFQRCFAASACALHLGKPDVET
jgi:predicted enzyme related to lactoylglutathione lyase